MSINFDNQKKTLSGKASNTTLAELLDSITEMPLLNISVSRQYAIGYENFEKQFKMDYAVHFHNKAEEIWLVKPTSSIRSDRMYGNEFFAQNIKILDKSVSKIYIAVPDSISAKEYKSKKQYSSKIHSGTYVSFIDDILTFSELRQRIIDYASQNLSQGISANILGTNAEETVQNLLTDKNNILLWNDYENNSATVKSATYGWFHEILTRSGFSKDSVPHIDHISSTTDLPRLSNNGYPKADVLFSVASNGAEDTRTISIKNTFAKTVTVHEGDVEDVILALKLNLDDPLASALREFQNYGSASLLSEFNQMAFDILNDNLAKYNKELVEFFLFGVNSPLVNDDRQVADLLLYTNNFEVMNRKEYVESYIRDFADIGQFGTPFKWTYPSKKRGKKIQIKGFTNNY